MLKKIAFVALLLMSPMALFAQDNQVNIVALVLTTANYNPSSDNIVSSLESLDAQILRVEAPNASEIRSILKRFSAAALDNDVALVFVDAPILKMGGREFLAPEGLNLRRRSDLLTQAIPVSAFARATTLAGNGGAVFVHSSDLGISLPPGIELMQIAPEERQGVSPVLVGQSGSSMTLANAFEQHAKRETMNLNSLLADLTGRIEFSVSYVPSRPLILSRTTPVASAPLQTSPPPVAEPTVFPSIQTETPATQQPTTQTDAAEADNTINLPQIQTPPVTEEVAEVAVEPVDDSEIKPLSLAMLEALQTGLSRNEKRDIQRGLRGLGFYSGLIDGIFGNQTKSSIESYQESIGAAVTGVLDVAQLNNFIN